MTLEVSESACTPLANQPAATPQSGASSSTPATATTTGHPAAGTLGLSALAAAALAACGGGSDGTGVAENPGNFDTPPAAPSGPISPEQAARFLHQAQFSSSDDEIAQVRAKGYEGWLTAQMAQPPTQAAWDWLIAGGYNGTGANVLDNDAYADYMVWYQLMQSSDAMRKRVALALSEIMVVSTTLIEG
uniref:DUF1800 family protein n=1 Tax=Ottowia sp. TaxID=1898956 RepID=UPI00345BEA32